MKNITRVLALLLALILVLGLVVTGFADDATSGTSAATKGKITINNAAVGETYHIYRILELESYSRDDTEARNGAYSYKAASNEWSAFILGEGSEYFTVTDNNTPGNVAVGYVSWKGEKTDTRIAAFAKKALEYAKKNNIQHDGEVVAQTTTVEFSNLDLGYYLLDSTTGTLCSLDTTNSEVNIREKNEAPTNTKLVQEDSKAGAADEYGTKNDADIGQTVYFKSTIQARAGARNYVFHDTMSEGLTFDGTVTVTKGANAEVVDATNYTLKTKDNADDSKKTTDGCTFEIVFTPDFCNTLTATDTIVISYSAQLNDKAHIGADTETEKNFNKSKLSYGDKSATEWSQTTTNTWEVKVFKFHKKSETVNTPLSGATFKLSKDEPGTTPINLVKVDNVADITYRVAKADANGAVTEITTDATGRFTIQGLDSDTYYLTEKEAPKGYNKLNKPIQIEIDNNGVVKVGGTAITGIEVGVENKTGAEMPSTGGIGTTVFYVVGGILAVGAAVLLVTKKRMERG